LGLGLGLGFGLGQGFIAMLRLGLGLGLGLLLLSPCDGFGRVGLRPLRLARGALRMSEDDLSDDELLAALRAEKQATQDNWQLSQLKTWHVADDWRGSTQVFLPNDDGAWKAADSFSSSSAFTINRPAGSPQELVVTEQNDAAGADVPARLLDPTVAKLTPALLRAAAGYQAVAKGYSFWSGGDAAAMDAPPADEVMLEVGIAVEDARVRLKALYAPVPEAPHKLTAFAIVRERRNGGDAAVWEGDAAFDGATGKGLYDPPSVSGEGADISLYEKRLTLRLPTVGGSQIGAVSLDWTADTMRYQVDRKFRELAGGLTSVELVEISAADAEIHPPDW